MSRKRGRRLSEVTLNDLKLLVYLVTEKKVPESPEKLARQIGVAENTLRYSIPRRSEEFGLLEEKTEGRIVGEGNRRYDVTSKGKEFAKLFVEKAVDIPTFIISIIVASTYGVLITILTILTLGDILRAMLITTLFLMLPVLGLAIWSIRLRRRHVRRLLAIKSEE